MAVNFSRFSVKEIREFLIEKGYEEDEVMNRKKIDLITFIEEEELENELDEQYPDEEVADVDFNSVELDEDELVHSPTTPSKPVKGTKEWNDYVMSLFNDEDYAEVPVDGGKKKIKGVKCSGLRRVSQIALGEIVESFAVDSGVNYPDYSISKNTDLVKLKNPPFAWVRYVVAFQNRYGLISRWGGCADVNANNTDPKFLPFAFATAETRAEARALKKALGINVLAVEELTSNDTAATVESITNADWEKGPITDQQKRSINSLAGKLKISTYRLINCYKDGDRVYFDENRIRNETLDDLTNEQASGVMVMLNQLQQNKLVKDDSLLQP